MSTFLIARAPCSAEDPLRVGVLVSGNGSNLGALIEAAQHPGCPFVIASVISNVKDAFAIDRAKSAGLTTAFISHRDFSDRTQFDEALLSQLKENNVELVVLAGFMRLLTSRFLHVFKHRVINVHPALSPAFPGLHAVREALEHGAWYTGCTVHVVNEGIDEGPVIAQSVVPIFDGDTEADLHQRIQQKEHMLLPQVVNAIAEGRVIMSGKHIQFLARNQILGQTDD